MMRKLLFVLALFLPSLAGAQLFPHQNWCEIGGKPALVQGLASTNDLQGSYPGCRVEVFVTGTGTHATLFSDSGGLQPLANPFTADVTNGYYSLYTAAGCYDAVTSGAGMSAPHTETFCLAASSTSGTVTSVTQTNNASSLISVGIANPTSTPAFTFGLTQFGAHTFWGNGSGSTATPSATTIGVGDLPFTYSGSTLKLMTSGTISGSAGTPLCLDGLLNATTAGCPVGGGYQTVQDEGISLIKRSIINFKGTGINCVDNSGALSTDCTVSPGSPSGAFQGNNGGAFFGIPGMSFSIPTGTESSSIKTTCVNNVCTANANLNFNVAPASPSTLFVGANTVTFTNCPDGVNGTDTVANSNPHYLLVISAGGDTAPTEPFLITGGSCLSGQPGTLSFNAAFAHIAGYHIASATSGIQETVQLSGVNPGSSIELVARGSYTCNAPIFLSRSDTKLVGNYAVIQDNSFDSCLVLGARPSFGASSGNQNADVSGIRFIPILTSWSVAPTGSISGLNATETVTIPTCPAGFYAAIPNQVLWVAGTASGLPTTPYGYGEFAFTTGVGTCTPGVVNGTVQISAFAFVNTTLSPHDNGYTISNNVAPYIEDALTLNGHIHDSRWVSGGGTQFAGYGIMVDNDQAAAIDKLDMDAGFWLRSDSDFQGAAVFSPGPFSSNAAVASIGPGLNISGAASCVRWYDGNDITFFNNVCQNYTTGAVVVGTKRGGFGRFAVNNNHFENGATAPPLGAVVGNPCIMVIGGNKPITAIGNDCDGNPFVGNNGSGWPTYKNSAGTAQYYYLVAHNNTLVGCTGGTDCVTVPVLMGNANVTDPSTDNVTVTFYGWGSGNLVVPTTQPSSYDLLAVTQASGFPQPPTAPGATVAVATGLLPGTICNIHNLCTITDNVAPGARAAYTPVYLSSSVKRYVAVTHLLPGVMSFSSAVGAANPSVLSTAGFRGTPACINSGEFFGKFYVASFFGVPPWGGGQLDSASCPPIIAPISSPGTYQRCLSSTGVCSAASSGSSTIAAAATTVTIQSAAVTMSSTFQVSENSTTGTILGVTCNTTLGRTYAVTAVVPGTSFTITSSAAPIATPACLDWKVVNQ